MVAISPIGRRATSGSVLSLRRVYLHNWHRFSDHLLDVVDSLYLAGHNGSGKSSILDAIQLLLLADLSRVRFNSSAQDRSQRNLDSYVRGKIGEGRYLRPGDTVAVLALEFGDASHAHAVTIGVCIEAGEGRAPERTFVIVPDVLERDLFFNEQGRALSRRELKQALRARKGARAYDNIGEYQADLLNRLGGLNERFFELFLRALTFQPIRNIRDFVEQWLLERRPLEVETLQRVVERLSQLRATAQDVSERLALLQTVVERQSEVRRLRERVAEYSLLTVLLHLHDAVQKVGELDATRAALAAETERAQTERAEAEAARGGAETALLDAEVQLRQSGVVRRRDELLRLLAAARAEAETIGSRWATLRGDIAREAQVLRPFVAAPALVEPERAAISALLAASDALNADPPPVAFAATIERAIDAADAAVNRARQEHFAAEQRLGTLRGQRRELEDALKQLERGQRPYPPETERLRDLLAPIVGERPPLLCDLLEVPDERWQDAVEALLGGRRFNIIVPPRRFEAALRELNRARAEEQLYEASLVDLGRVRSDGRPAQPNSLARQVAVRSGAEALRPYLDTVLGDIICCETVDALRTHRRSVTAEVVYYGEWTVRALRPGAYRPWFIGDRALRAQLEQRRDELAAVRAEAGLLQRQERDLSALVAGLDRGRALSNLRLRLDAPLDAQPLLAQIAGYTEELQALDVGSVAVLEREVQRLRTIVAAERKREAEANARLGSLQTRRQLTEQSYQAAQRERADRAQQASEGRARYGAAAPAAEALLAERLADSQASIPDLIRNAESTANNFRTREANQIQLLTGDATTYNTRYQFGGRAFDPDEASYGAERERLAASELPRYTEQIEQAQREAEEELREHVLHRLREHVLNARQQLDRINGALDGLDFHGERYRFRTQPAEEVREYYDLITDTQLLGAGPLFASEFYATHRVTFDRLYAALTHTPQSDAERAEQERLTDYRRYLSYDIEVTHADGRTSRLSKIMGQTSGGETQTPFYLTIAASFVQLYHINERVSRPTIRLVAFDEAFSKMDQDRIGATLELFQQFGLQIITATPLERCEYLVPKMCTNLVLTTVGDQVLIEPYHNYAARLADINEEAL